MTKYKQFNELSINLWVNFNTIDDYIFAWSEEVYEIGYDSVEDRFEFRVWDEDGQEYEIAYDEVVSTGEWYMVTLIYDMDNLYCSVNSGTLGTVLAGGKPLYDGQDDIHIGELEGKCAEFRLYDYAIEDSAIQELYDTVQTEGKIQTDKRTM